MSESKRGTVEKFIGDAVIAVFGAPTAHEDDAERALRAGLALLEGLKVSTCQCGSASTPARRWPHSTRGPSSVSRSWPET